MTTLSKKKVKNAIPGSLGIYAIIAKKCGVDRSTITKFLKKERNKNILLEIEEEREKILDIGEKKLIGLVNDGEFPAIKFLLSTKGKNRGYIEKKELNVHDERTRIIIEKADNDNNKVETKQKAGTSTGSPSG